jgi:hypothetical protein
MRRANFVWAPLYFLNDVNRTSSIIPTVGWTCRGKPLRRRAVLRIGNVERVVGVGDGYSDSTR